MNIEVRRKEKRGVKSSKNDEFNVVIEVVVEFNGKEIFFILELYFLLHFFYMVRK